MSFLHRLFRLSDPRDAQRPLYDGVVRVARDPVWYRDGAVPDTLDGRFEAVALIVSLVLHRIERDEPRAAVHLTELFVDDMDAQVRQIGFGDMVVGKQIGKMMGALGGRLTAYRAPIGEDAFRDALIRNLWRGEAPGAESLAVVERYAGDFARALAAMPTADIARGVLPTVGAA